MARIKFVGSEEANSALGKKRKEEEHEYIKPSAAASTESKEDTYTQALRKSVAEYNALPRETKAAMQRDGSFANVQKYWDTLQNARDTATGLEKAALSVRAHAGRMDTGEWRSQTEVGMARQALNNYNSYVERLRNLNAALDPDHATEYMRSATEAKDSLKPLADELDLRMKYATQTEWNDYALVKYERETAQTSQDQRKRLKLQADQMNDLYEQYNGNASGLGKSADRYTSPEAGQDYISKRGEYLDAVKKMGYASIPEFEDARSKLNAQIALNQRTSDLYDMESAALNAADFAPYMQRAESGETSIPEDRQPAFWEQLVDELNNTANADAIGPQGTLNTLPGDQEHFSDNYGHYTKEEQAIYAYYRDQEDKGLVPAGTATKYLKMLEDRYNLRGGQEIAGLYEDNKFAEILFGLNAGFEQFGIGEQGLFKMLTKDDSYVAHTMTQYAGQLIGEDLNADGVRLPAWLGGTKNDDGTYTGPTLGKAAYDLVTTMANMGPSMAMSAALGMVVPGAGEGASLARKAISKIPNLAGAMTLGGSAGGNAYLEMIQNGYSHKQAATYGWLTGLSEAGLEYVLGGISKLSSGAIQSIGGKSLEEFAKSFSKSWVQFAIKYGGKFLLNVGSEMVEEGLQDVIQPYMYSIATGEIAEDVDWNQAMYSALLGGVSAFLMDGGGVSARFMIDIAPRIAGALRSGDVSSLINLGKTFDKYTTVAGKIAAQYDGADPAKIKGLRDFAKLTMMYMDMTNAATNDAQVQHDIQYALLEAGADRYMTMEQLVDLSEQLPTADYSEEMYALFDAHPELSAIVSDVFVHYFEDASSPILQREAGLSQLATDEEVSLGTEGALKKYRDAYKNAKEHYDAGMVEVRDPNSASGTVSMTTKGLARQSAEQLGAKIAAKNKAARTNSLISPRSSIGIDETAVSEMTADRADGKVDVAKTENNAPVRIESSEKSANGMRVVYADGTTKSAAAAVYENESQRAAYNAVMSLGSDAPVNTILQAVDMTASPEAIKRQVLELSAAVRMGKINVDMRSPDYRFLTQSLSARQKKYAYDVGRALSTSERTAKPKSETAVKETGSAENQRTVRKGRVYIDTTSGLTDRQKVSVAAIGRLQADITGNEVHFFSSKKDSEGVPRLTADLPGTPYKKDMVAPNGYFTKDGKVYIDLNAGNFGEGTILWTAAHEFTHFIAAYSDMYGRLQDFVINTLTKNGASLETLIAAQIRKAKADGIKLSRDEAIEEVVADALSEMFTRGDALTKLERLRNTDRTLWEKLRDFFTNLRDKIRAAYQGLNPDTEEARIMRRAGKQFDKIADLFSEALYDAGQNYKTTSEMKAVGISADARTESVSPKLSLRTWTESDYVTDRNAAAKELAAMLGVTQKKARKYIDDVNGIAKMIADDRSRLDYLAAEGLSSFVGNVEYGGSIDFSTLCAKRRYITGTIQEIQKRLGESVLTPMDILKIRNMMKERKYVVNCGLCYVEGSRSQMGVFANQFIDRFKQHYPNAEWTPRMQDVFTPVGIEHMRTEHPDVYALYEKFWNNHGKVGAGDSNLFASQQKPKQYQMRTDYKSEILKKFDNQNEVKLKNENGGIRIQSFSDFEIVHAIDMMQVIMDMARVGLAGQAYTKVPEFAWMFGNTGLKINLSLITKGVDENGKLIFDDVEGMPHDEAFKIRDTFSKNVGTILVTFDDAQLKAAMADDRIDFIIPFHRSQWTKKQYPDLGLPATTKDYTYVQNEKYQIPKFHEFQGRLVKDKAKNFMPNTYWDFSKTEKENAEAYLKMCHEDGRRPKFYKLLDAHPDGSYTLKKDGSTDGYWKLLIDFKMYDNDGKGSPQMPVTPSFNMGDTGNADMDAHSIQTLLDAYEGGHDSFPVAEDVADDFVKEYKGKAKGKASPRGSENTFEDKTTEESVKYSVRQKEPPKKTRTAYKVFFVKNGKLYPPMVANPGGEDTPVGVWLDADVGVQAPDSKTGRKQVKAGGKGTQGGSGSLSFRPGWHLGEIPLATQFDRVNPETGVKELFPESFVWAECEIAADVDYQEEAMSSGYTKNGKFQHSLAGLPRVPVDGYYQYRTNPNPDTVPWLITGAMKVTRLLDDEDVNEILAEHGIAPKMRLGGNKTLADLGLKQITGEASPSVVLYEGKNLAEDESLYTRDFMESLPDMHNTHLPAVSAIVDKNGKVIPSRIAEIGIKNALAYGEERGGKVFDNYGVPFDEQARYSLRDRDPYSARSLLGAALETAAQNDVEREMLAKYQTEAAVLDDMQRRLGEVRAEIKELSFAKGPRDTERLSALKEEATRLANNVTTADKRLLRMAASAPLSEVVKTEKAKAREREKAVGRERLKEEQAKAAVRQAEAVRKTSEHYKERIEKIRQAGWDRLAKQQAEHVEMRKEERDRRAASNLRTRIKELHSEMMAQLEKGKGNTAIPRPFVQSLVDICALIDPTGPNPNSQAAQRYRTKLEALQALRNVYDSLPGAADPDISSVHDPEYSQYLLDLANMFEDGAKPIRSMNRAELEQLYTIMKSIWTKVRDAKRVIGENRSQTLEEARENVARQTRALPKKIGKGPVSELARNWALNPVRAALEMSGYNEGAQLYRDFMEIVNGFFKGETFRMNAEKVINATRTTKADKKAYEAATRDPVITIKDVDGNDVGITLMQAMQLVMTYEREIANKNHGHLKYRTYIADATLLAKGKFDKATMVSNAHEIYAADADMIARLYDEIGKNEWALRFMEAAKTVLQTMSTDAINEVSMILDGVPLAREKAYIPYVISREFINEAAGNAKDENRQKVSNLGFTKRLVPNSGAPVMIVGLNTILDRHIDDVAKYYGLAIPVRNWDSIYNFGKRGNVNPVVTTINARWGNSYDKVLNRAVADIQSPRPGEKDITRLLRKVFVAATLVGNASVTIKQMASYPTAGLYLSTGSLQYGVNHFLTTQNQKIWDEIDKHTPLHYMRRQGLSQEEIAMIAREPGLVNTISEKLSTVKGSPWKWIQNADVNTTAALWLACKHEIEKTKSYEKGSAAYWAEVTSLYEKVITETQPMYDPLHRSEISKGSITRYFMFKTQPIQQAGIMHDAINELRFAMAGTDKARQKAAAKRLGRAVSSTLQTVAVFATMTMMAKMLTHKMAAYRDDDDELTWISILHKLLIDSCQNLVTSYIPVIGDLGWNAIDTIVNRKSYDLISDPSIEMVNTLFKSFTSLYDETIDPEKDITYEDAMKFATGIAGMFGIPAANIERLLHGLVDHGIDIANGEFMKFEAGYTPGAKQADRRLYEAIVNGDTEYVDEHKKDFDTMKDFHAKQSELLRTYDPRIQEAAKDTLALQPHLRKQLYEEIVAEGHFGTSDVINAIVSETAWLRSKIIYAVQAEQKGLTAEYDKAIKEMTERGYDEGVISISYLLNQYRQRPDAEQWGDKVQKDEGWWEEEDTGVAANNQYSESDIYSVLLDGDDEDIREMYDTLVDGYISKGKSEEEAVKTTQTTYRSAIKDQYEREFIDRQTATEYLKTYGGLDSDEIYWKFKEWDADLGEGETWHKYDDLYDALDSGYNIESVISEYTSHGVKAENVAKEVSGHFKPIYEAASSSEKKRLKPIIERAYRACDKDPSKLRWLND